MDPTDPPRDPTGPPVRVTLVGRPGCHLCDAARVVVAAVTADLGVGWVELSIDDDPDLHARYADQIPVTIVDGVQHDFWRVSEPRLRATLARPARGPGPAPGEPGPSRR